MKIWIKKELYILNYEFMKFYAFFWFLFDFLFDFFLLKSRKRAGLLPASADVASGSSDELTRGARDHRMGATRRWGHVAEPWVAHAERRRRTMRGHVARGHAVHVGAPVGRHVAEGGLADGGPMG